MSASDAAPLPRLGEVFFDVRGSSRSMRLSWYADTGVAVFSIWQGGMCTGTFRLPIGDLPRMIDILQRGPQDDARPGHPPDHDWPFQETSQSGQRDFPTGGTPRPDRDDRYAERPLSGHGREDLAETATPGYGRDELGDARRAGYGRDNLADGPRRAGYGRDDLGDARRTEFGRDEPADAQRAGYWQDDSAHAEGPFGRDAFSDGPYPGYQAEAHPAGPAAQPGWPEGAEAEYGQERFVPPYVRRAPGEYSNDIPAQIPDQPATGRRPAYHGDPDTGRLNPDDYGDPGWEPSRYSDEQRYRLSAEPSGGAAGDWIARPSAGLPDAEQPAPAEPGGHSTERARVAGIHDERRDYRPRRGR